MYRPVVLIAHSDPGVRRLVRRIFLSAGHSVITAKSSREAFDQVRRNRPDAVILSHELVSTEFAEFMTKLRSLSSAPVLVLMEQNISLERVAAFNAGADDCMDEPFFTTELTARIQRLLQRSAAYRLQHLLRTPAGILQIDSVAPQVTVNGKQVKLTWREYELLVMLAAADGACASADDIARAIWSQPEPNKLQNLRKTVSSLRHKLGGRDAGNSVVATVRGAGYRLVMVQESHDTKRRSPSRRLTL